jgi:hypothetical protein
MVLILKIIYNFTLNIFYSLNQILKNENVNLIFLKYFSGDI